ncbi:MAG: hypothetical protein K2P79_10345, partial [Sphingomonas sp.]|nr:hypothetical protein [Sphingomonas sp.]
MRRYLLLGFGALPLVMAATTPARAQDLQDRPAQPAPPSDTSLPKDLNEVQFSANGLEYDSEA